MSRNQASQVSAVEKATPSKTEEGSFQTLKALTVSSAHAVHDTYAGFIAPLLPFLIDRLSLLKAEAGLFLLLYQGASVLQPFIGHLGDRKNLRKYALLMPAITGISLSFLAVVPNLWIGLLLCLIAGISSASLHSILPALVSSLSGKQLGKGMSVWMIGGEFGIMLGPILVTAVAATFSVYAVPWLALLGIGISVALSFLLRDMPYHNAANGNVQVAIPTRELAAIILPLTGVVLMRAPLRTASEIFLPVYLIEKGINPFLAGSSISLLLGFGMLGTMVGGPLRDRFGFRKVIIGSVFFASVGMIIFSLTSGWMQVFSLALVGASSMMILPVGLAYILENFPNNRSLANGLYLAIAFSINAVSGVLTGFLYDTFGGFNTFLWSGFISFLGIPFVFLLPREKEKVEA
jgi:FSR family fosmidomycin resistance protein-like MFS transporter